MLKTLKVQIALVLLSLVALLILQAVMSHKNQNTFFSGLELSQGTIEKVNLVRDLEKDILDLQRIVLIYKETASISVKGRFDATLEAVTDNLNALELIIRPEDNVLELGALIDRMKTHLLDYQDNFTTVVDGRSRRQLLIDDAITSNVDGLIYEIALLENSSDFNASEIQNLTSARYHISSAYNKTLIYMINPDSGLVDSFNTQVGEARETLTATPNLTENTSAVVRNLDKFSQQFVQLRQITRGYIFLVNVVMAGSANEFLYLARELNTLVTLKQASVNEQVFENTVIAQTNSYAFSLISILLALLVAAFFVYRVILPINGVTEIFNKLARGDKVDNFPQTNRKDEIGELAKAAQVFNERNQQTNELLNSSRQLNARQESLNQELAMSTLKAEQATASKSIFLANMSHEIRTPMNGIIGLVDIVLQSDLGKKQRELVSKIAYSSQILMSLINDILDFSKIEAGKLQIENIRYSPASLFENLLANITAKASEKNLNLHFYVNPDLPREIIGDPLRTSQILLNLVSNAIKFTRNGSVKIFVDFEPTEGHKIMLTLSIVDTGIGMTQQQLSDVFRPFTQADGSTSRKFGGTGLGLSIVKQLLEMMGGSIDVKSTYNVGSEFVVKLELEAIISQHRIFSKPHGPIEHVFYYSVNHSQLTPDAYLKALDPKYMTITPNTIEVHIENANPEAIFIFDVDNMASYKDIHRHIELAKQKKCRIGLVTNTQPSTLSAILTKKLDIPVLSHPFSTDHFTDFVRSVMGVESIGGSKQTTKVQQPRLALSGHVLLVEDNHINQIVAGEMLKQQGLTYDTAEDGLQAVTKIINSSHYDIVLMDIQMPNMDGYEATKMLRSKGYEKLIICGLSANAMEQDFKTARESGMNEYLTKPIEQDKLSEILAKYLS